MNHNFSKSINFDEQYYRALDEAINLFFETYVSIMDEYVRKIIHTPKNEVNIYKVQDNYLLNFIRYGLALRDGGFILILKFIDNASAYLPSCVT